MIRNLIRSTEKKKIIAHDILILKILMFTTYFFCRDILCKFTKIKKKDYNLDQSSYYICRQKNQDA